jgi:NTP pyrophosphatase (non-canonical NTP hydrolase)
MIQGKMMKTQQAWLVASEVVAERARQDAKWGVQPLPDITDDFIELDELPSEATARNRCDSAHERGVCSHAHVLLEETIEAFEAAKQGDTTGLRKELIQVAAVCVKWVQHIDRRGAL